MRDVIRATTVAEEPEMYEAAPAKKMTKKEREKTIAKMEAEMKEAAKKR